MRLVEGAEILAQLAIEHIGRRDGQSIQRLRERVVHVEAQPVGDALSHVQLERVIPGVAARKRNAGT